MHCVHILQLLKAFIIINVTTLIIKSCLYNDWFVTCCKAVQDIRAQITPIYCNSICFQVKPFLREESGALLFIPCSLGSSESFLCVKIKLGELLLIVSLNGQCCQRCFASYKKTKIFRSSHQSERETANCIQPVMRPPEGFEVSRQLSTITFHYCLSYF